MLLFQTNRWHRSLRPSPSGHRCSIAAWLAAAGGLLVWWACSWFAQTVTQDLAGRIEAALGVSNGQPEWWQHGDAPLHLTTAAALLCVLHWGHRLFRPAWPWWSATAATVAMALGDEGLQGLSDSRSCDWYDLAADAVGITVALAALGLCGLLARTTDQASPLREAPHAS